MLWKNDSDSSYRGNSNSFLDELDRDGLFFFAGSGISYLSSIPSVMQILALSSEAFLLSQDTSATLKQLVQRVITTIQPELFYENILISENFNYDTLLLWKSVSSIFMNSKGVLYEPNINHFYIVDYSYANKVPIFTTNFDNMFERAASLRGYEYKVILPFSKEEQIYADPSKHFDGLLIFKLHGTADFEGQVSIKSLFTTMSLITKNNADAINLIKCLRETLHMVYVGYSGRDIDFFPEVNNLSNLKRAYWIDKFHDKVTYENSALIKAFRIYDYPDKIFIRKFIEFPQYESPSTEKIQTVLCDVQTEVIKKIPLTQDEKILNLCILLNSCGLYKDGFELLNTINEKSIPKTKKTIFSLTLSDLSHETSRFKSSGRAARKALYFSKQNKQKSFHIRSLSQISESKRMNIPSDAGIGYNPMRYLPWILVAILSFFINHIRMKRLLNIAFKNVLDFQLEPSYHFAIEAFIEHKIRFLGLVQGVVINNQVTPNRMIIFLKNELLKNWDKIIQSCKAVGYTHGLGTSIRYKNRLSNEKADLSYGNLVFNLTSNATGISLLRINYANEVLDHEPSLALNLFLESADKCRQCGNNLLFIKSVVGIARARFKQSGSYCLTKNEVSLLRDATIIVQSDLWKNYIHEIINVIDIK